MYLQRRRQINVRYKDTEDKGQRNITKIRTWDRGYRGRLIYK